MKTLVLAAFALAFGAPDVFAASELYFVQDMECRGTVEGNNLRCTAHVVGEDEIKRIDDNTARR